MPLYFENEEVEINTSAASYNDLSDKPVINSVTLEGNLLLSDLGLGNVINYCGEIDSEDMLPEISNKGDLYFVKGNKTTYIFDGIKWVAIGTMAEGNAVIYKPFVYNEQVRKTIELANYDSISGLDTKGEGHNLAMVSKWDVADFGGPSLHLNLNTKDNITINDNKIVATKDDIDNKADNNQLEALLTRIQQLEDRIIILNRTNTQPILATETTPPILTDMSKDYVVQGVISNPATMKGKSITLNNIDIKNGAKIITYTKDLNIMNSTIVGNYESKSGKVMDLNDSDYVVIKNTTFNASSAYNIIEIGLNGSNLPKSVLIEDCKFLGEYNNNAILIFGTKDNAVININNCYFQKLSNILRLSNKINAKNVTVNITNCTCDYWDVSPTFAGMIICQDYTSGTIEAMEANNLFGNGKIKINISNMVGPYGKLVMKDLNLLCGSQTQEQILFLWDTKRGTVPYNETLYPLLNIS